MPVLFSSKNSSGEFQMTQYWFILSSVLQLVEIENVWTQGATGTQAIYVIKSAGAFLNNLGQDQKGFDRAQVLTIASAAIIT